MSQERATLTVSRASWHGRVYLRWKARASIKAGPGYRENLCHYVRVVLIWAPARFWLEAAPSERLWFVTPSAVTAVLALAGGVWLAFHLAFAGTLLVAEWAGAALAAAPVLGLVAALAARNSDALAGGLDRTFDALERGGRGFGRTRAGRWLKRNGAQALALLVLAAVAATGLGWAVWAILNYPHRAWVILLWALVAVAGILLLLGLCVLCGWVEDEFEAFSRFWAWLGRRFGHGAADAAVASAGFARVAFRFAAARKGRICPFIDVEEG